MVTITCRGAMFNTPCPSLVASRFLLLTVQLYCTVSDRKLGMETGLPRPLCVCVSGVARSHTMLEHNMSRLYTWEILCEAEEQVEGSGGMVEFSGLSWNYFKAIVIAIHIWNQSTSECWLSVGMCTWSIGLHQWQQTVDTCSIATLRCSVFKALIFARV